MATRRSLTVFATLAAVLLTIASLAACGGAPGDTTVPTTEREQAPPTELDGKSLVEERCADCHGLERVERAGKTEEEWRSTVERMVDKGADLDAEEQEAVIQYLAETYPK